MEFDSDISLPVFEKSEFTTDGLSQPTLNKISQIKHRRHFPIQDTKSRIFGYQVESNESKASDDESQDGETTKNGQS